MEQEPFVVQSGTVSVEKKGLAGKTWEQAYATLQTSQILQLSRKTGKLIEIDIVQYTLDLTKRGALILRLNSKAKAYALKFNSSSEVDAWILAFRSFQMSMVLLPSQNRSILNPSSSNDTDVIPVDDITPYIGFASKAVKKWKQVDVQNWLSFIHVDFDKTCITIGLGYVLQQLKIDGKALLALDIDALNNSRNHKFSEEVIQIFTEELAVARRKKFSKDRYLMIQKLAKNQYARKHKFSTLMKQGFLRLYDVDYIRSIMPFNPQRYSVTSRLSLSSSDLPQKVSIPVRAMSEPTPRISSSLSVTTIASENTETTQVYQFKVKLVLTEIPSLHHVVKSVIRTPFVDFTTSALGFPSLWGFFHSALIIGPFYLEWGNSEWVFPKSSKQTHWSSANALFAGDIGVVNLRGEKELTSFSELVYSHIAQWSVHGRYRNLLEPKTSLNGNCQDYVQDLLHAISAFFTPQKHEIIDEFLAAMKSHGCITPTFIPSEQFRKEFAISEKKITFKSHKELDEFVSAIGSHCLTANVKVEEMFPGEYLLMKAWDRSFWLRYNSSKDSRFEHHNCPFGDPESTHSFKH